MAGFMELKSPNHPNPFMPYIIRIAKNQALKKLEYNQAVKRNSYYDCTLEELENHVVSLTSVENALEEEALKTFINQFLAKEKKIDRILFVKRYWYLESIDDIVRECGKLQLILVFFINVKDIYMIY